MSSNGLDDGHSSSIRDRSPRPYELRDGIVPGSSRPRTFSPGHRTPSTLSFHVKASRNVSGGSSSLDLDHDASESGTEADDERPKYLALPAPPLRLRKGLIHSDGTASPLLTPSQLDQQGQRFFQAQIDREPRSRTLRSEDLKKLEDERIQFEIRRRAERIRRVSEAALIGVIGAAVLLGSRIWRLSWQWYLVEVLGQVSAIAGLVGFYPLRLVSVEHRKGHVHIWSRFHIPPSFDPATILYPTFLPVFISLCFVHQLPEAFLPNTILGLASLPPRLFPTWTRGSPLNVLHWSISVVPVILSRAAGMLARRVPSYLAFFAPPQMEASLSPEWLVVLYPLHQALLGNIHYLTTSSLLPTEKHLLSTALINVLLFAASPQIMILRAIIWIGGSCALISLTHILRWNVALARIPTWKLRHFRRSKPLSITALIKEELSAALSYIGLSPQKLGDESETEEEDATFNNSQEHLKPELSPASTFHDDLLKASLAVESDESSISGLRSAKRQLSGDKKRRNTIASPREADFGNPSLSQQSRPRTKRKRNWAAKLSPLQATLRKRFYAAYAYTAMAAIILIPVRLDVSWEALSNAEPIFWALDYLFGDLPSLAGAQDFLTTALSSPISSLPTLRSDLGPANTRLALILYYAAVLVLGLAAVLILSPTIEVDTRRKIFHAIMVTMFLPTVYVDPCFCHLALTLVLAVFLLLEVLRAAQVPPLGAAIAGFVAPYVDGRDLRGPMVVSHVFLLVGCAIPFWLSCAAFERDASGWDLAGDRREAAMLAGVVCVGMGDAAASLIGRRFGRRKWPWIGGKSLEGSAAFALAVCVGLAAAKLWLRLGGWVDVNAQPELGVVAEAGVFIGKALVAGCGASFMEAVLTGANDNVVVPVALWLLCRGLRV